MVELDRIAGVIPPVITPVDVNEEPDEAALNRVLDHCLDGGVHGVFVMGSTGEAFTFGPEVQNRVVRMTVDHIAGRVPVFAGASANTTRDSIRMARMAEEAGADVISVLTPMILRLSDQELFTHYSRIAESISLPLILYNNPGLSANNISPELLRRLAGVDNIIGIKNTTLDFSQTIQYLRITADLEDFRILSGTDFYIYATLAHGGKGCVAGTANVAPELVSGIYNKFMEGDHEGALRNQLKLVRLRNTYSLGSFPVVIKDCLNLMGMDVGPPVKPVSQCDPESQEKLKQVLKEFDLI
jgi:4-hydroxy-tetrahydrodipicolinate synthase